MFHDRPPKRPQAPWPDARHAAALVPSALTIATLGGPVPVRALRAGDRVLTLDEGYRPLLSAAPCRTGSGRPRVLALAPDGHECLGEMALPVGGPHPAVLIQLTLTHPAFIRAGAHWIAVSAPGDPAPLRPRLPRRP